MEHLQAFIADCDRRTEAAKRRLAETQEELTAEVQTKANAVHELAEEIGKKLAKAEALGEAGQVEESMQLMGEIEDLRIKKARAEHEYRSSIPASSYQQQKLRVCEVCSAYLGIHDNDVRLADHFGGKLHLGEFIGHSIVDQILMLKYFQAFCPFARSFRSSRRPPVPARRKCVQVAIAVARRMKAVLAATTIVAATLEHVS